MLVITVRSTKDGRTNRAGEMLNVVFAIQRGYIRPTKRVSARVTEEVKATKIVPLTEGVLIRSMFGVWEELGGDGISAVLYIC